MKDLQRIVAKDRIIATAVNSAMDRLKSELGPDQIRDILREITDLLPMAVKQIRQKFVNVELDGSLKNSVQVLIMLLKNVKEKRITQNKAPNHRIDEQHFGARYEMGTVMSQVRVVLAKLSVLPLPPTLEMVVDSINGSGHRYMSPFERAMTLISQATEENLYLHTVNNLIDGWIELLTLEGVREEIEQADAKY